MIASPTAATRPMTDPSEDELDPEWCFSPKTLTWTFQLYWTQVTYDGALYSLHQAEFCFFSGSRFKHLLARLKTFLDGWIPIVE